MKIISLSQHSDEWHAWRKAGIGASEAGSIAADAGLVKPASWMDTTHDLWEKKLGRQAPTAWNPAMQRGTDGEDAAAALYTQMTGNMISPVCAEMDEFPFVHASFDGLSWEGDLFAEIKCPSKAVFELAEQGIVVDYYKPQLAQQALVAWGHPDQWNLANQVHFFAYIPEEDRGALVKLTAGDLKDLALALLPLLGEFWSHVEEETEPCGDAWLAAAERYKAAEAELAEIKAIHEIAKQRMISLLPEGTKKRSGGGVTVSRSTKAGSISYAQCVKDLKVAEADLEKYRGEESTSYRITVSEKNGLPELTDAVKFALSA